MKLLYFLITFFNFLLVTSFNLRNLVEDNNLMLSKSQNYITLTQEAKKAFYQLFEIELDFKDRYYLEIDDDTKYLRIIINENITNNENYDSFEYKNRQINSVTTIPEDIFIILFGRTYKLKEEFENILNSIYHYTNVTFIDFDKENTDKFDTISKYELYVNSIGTIDVILEDKDDKVAIKEELESFWNSVEVLIPKECIKIVRYAAEFVAITFGVRRAVINRREKLEQVANEIFYELYNVSLDFKGKSMITHNEDGRYYQVLINEYPKYEGDKVTKVSIKNSRVFIPDFYNFEELTFTIFGRKYSLKEEYLSILYLLAPIIKDGVIIIEKMNLDTFDSQINYKVELFRENEPSQGGFEIIFEDKDDKNEIENTLNSFWNTWSSEIPKENQIVARLISQFVVTNFGIWHKIQNRYEKIVSAATESLFQLLNITIDFKGRYIYSEANNIYEISVLIDEYPLRPADFGTYFNISNGKAIFPNYAEITNPDYYKIKLNISNNLFDVDEEYKAFGNMFAIGMRNGKVIIYKKNIEGVSNLIRFKCFLNSQNNEEYGSFEISLKYIEKTKWEKIKEGINNFWENAKKFLKELNEGVKLVSEIVGNVLALKEQLINKKAYSSYLRSNIGLIILSNLLFLIIL